MKWGQSRGWRARKDVFQCSRFGPLSVCDPHGRALRVLRGPRAPSAPMSFISGLRPDGKASARQWTGWTARVDTGDGAAWRLAPGSSASQLSQPRSSPRSRPSVSHHSTTAGAQVRPRKWAAEPASSSGSATMTSAGRIRDRRPSRRIVAAAGLWHPIATCPDGQPGEWSLRRRSWSPN